MAFAKRDMQSSASIAVNYLEPSSSLGLNGLAISCQPLQGFQAVRCELGTPQVYPVYAG